MCIIQFLKTKMISFNSTAMMSFMHALDNFVTDINKLSEFKKAGKVAGSRFAQICDWKTSPCPPSSCSAEMGTWFIIEDNDSRWKRLDYAFQIQYYS